MGDSIEGGEDDEGWEVREGKEKKVCAEYNFAGETFVTRKVSRSVAQIHLGQMESVSSMSIITSNIPIMTNPYSVYDSSSLLIIL